MTKIDPTVPTTCSDPSDLSRRRVSKLKMVRFHPTIKLPRIFVVLWIVTSRKAQSLATILAFKAQSLATILAFKAQSLATILALKPQSLATILALKAQSLATILALKFNVNVFQGFPYIRIICREFW